MKQVAALVAAVEHGQKNREKDSAAGVGDVDLEQQPADAHD
jgi:hypothetical protein